MIRNIDILIEIQDRIHKFRILDDVIAVMLEDKDTEFSDLIETPCQEMCDILNAINDIDKLLDSLTEDLRGSMVNDGFDPDDYKFWNACLIHSPYNLEFIKEGPVDDKFIETYTFVKKRELIWTVGKLELIGPVPDRKIILTKEAVHPDATVIVHTYKTRK